MSPGVVSDSYLESRLALHAKWNNFNWQFSLEKCNFWNVMTHRQIICHFEAFFATSKNLGSLPLKSLPIGLDQVLKFRIIRQMGNFLATFNGWSGYEVKVELTRDWLGPKLQRFDDYFNVKLLLHENKCTNIVLNNTILFLTTPLKIYIKKHSLFM